MNKKGQGIDALVSTVLLAVLSMGGIFFLNTFIDGMTYESLTSIMDQEIDERCFFAVLPMMGDEYIKAGDDLSGNTQFENMQNYFGGTRKYMYISSEFEGKIVRYKSAIGKMPFEDKPQMIEGFLASNEKANDLTQKHFKKLDDEGLTPSLVCFVPNVYNPAGRSGRAELITAKEGE